MRRFALILSLLAVLLVACNPLAPEPTPTAAPTLTPTSAPPTHTPESTDTPNIPQSFTTRTPSTRATIDRTEAMLQLIEVEEDTEKIRGLEPKSDVPEQFSTQEELSANLADEIAEDYSHEEARRDASTLWLLRLLDDPSIDLYQLQIDLLGEQVLGYYDHEKKDLFVRSDRATLSPLSRVTLSHEFVHSLQDQHFDLTKMRPDDIENDRGNAVLALVEGDAVAAQIAYAQKYLSADDLQALLAESNSISQDVMDNAPRYVRESLIFPYDQGPLFISELAGTQPGSFKAVNDALADPPQSTEQVLHPEKYLSTPRDEPMEVSLPPLTDTLGTGWTLQDSDTLGEFDLKMMMQINGVDNPEAWEGWGGARYDMYEKGDDALVLVQSKWDTMRDAVEFAEALRDSMGTIEQSDDLWSDSDGKRTFGIRREGDTVTYIAGTDRASVQRVLASIK